MFNVTKDNTEIKVEVVLKKRKLARDPHVGVDTKKVLDFLVKEGYNLENYKLIKSSECSNLEGANTRNSGIWVWKKEVKKNANTKTTTKVTRSRSLKPTPTPTPTEKKQDKLLRTKDME